jgi:6-hydroxycyclohex-1-ene-1-carbonyl-CoA dehydrogenase
MEVKMGVKTGKIKTWQMIKPWSKDGDKMIPGVIERRTIDMPSLKPGEVIVEIAGCGVCHTDLGFFYAGVPTIQQPPLALGHEISGKVIAGDESFIGKEVIIPAVLPCHKCPICASGRNNRCLNQCMPGYSFGIYGGFSDYIVVPSRDLCVIKNRGEMPLEYFSVVADAITTPYQAALRADIKEGDLCVVIGAGGGVGSYMTQICKILGAKVVIGLDLVDDKLQRALKYGATHVINTKGKGITEIRNEYRGICEASRVRSNYDWKIFEVAGTGECQEIALGLLQYVSKLIVIGYCTAKTEFMFSRLMAFDSEIIGTWGCPPQYYPIVLQMVLDKRIEIEAFVETKPMSKINEVFEEVHAKPPFRRIILTPDF